MDPQAYAETYGYGKPEKKTKDWSALISMMSNLGIQYNIQVIVVVLELMTPFYPIKTSQIGTIKSLLFAGAVTGQLTMGYAGDCMGRRKAMILTNVLTVLGSIGSAACTFGDPTTVYAVMMACRFIIGVGVGGKYPLAASMRSEGNSDEIQTSSKSGVSTEVAKGFFWQTPGAILPYLLALGVLGAGGYKGDTHLPREFNECFFRILLALGAIPSIVVIIASCVSEESEQFTKARQQMNEGGGGGTTNPLIIACRHTSLWGKLFGAGMSWFLYDFCYYGVSLYQPTVLKDIFGKDDSLFNICWQNVVVSAMGLPAVITAILALRIMDSKQLQVWGFLFIAGVFGLLAWLLQFENKWLNFAIFSLLIASTNWGPNVSTYVIPTEIFPSGVRSSMFGLSAALGKIGALLAGMFFPFISQNTSESVLYLICAGICLLAIVVTHFYTPSDNSTFWCCNNKHETRAPEADYLLNPNKEDQSTYMY